MPNLRKLLLFFGDVILLYLSLIIALILDFSKRFSFDTFWLHFLPFTLLYFFWLIIFYIFGLYDLNLIKKKVSFYSRAIAAFFVCFVAGIIFFYGLPSFGISPKINLAVNILLFGLFFFGWRNLFYSLFSSYFQNRLIILGQGPDVENLRREVSEKPYIGYKLITISEKEDLFSQIQKENIDTVIFTEELETDPSFLKALYFCLPARVNFIDFARAYEIINEKIPVSTISHGWFLENLKEGEKWLYDGFKRWEDMILSFLLLLITFPLWPFIALAIKLQDGGPIFYKQTRVGKGGKNFLLLKFRSMVPEAEKEGPQWAKSEDDRVTKFGSFLRRSHLDEIPQMLNILKGDLSLVGPRPERPEFFGSLQKEIPHYQIRNLIKPGFTGWAQIKFRYGRTVSDQKEKFEYDLYYLKNRGVLLDTSILLKTFQLLFIK